MESIHTQVAVIAASYLIIFGSAAVVVAIWQPRGLWGMIRDRFHFELLPVGYRVRERSKKWSAWPPMSSLSDHHRW